MVDRDNLYRNGAVKRVTEALPECTCANMGVIGDKIFQREPRYVRGFLGEFRTKVFQLETWRHFADIVNGRDRGRFKRQFVNDSSRQFALQATRDFCNV
jgi:hypothetical protein